MDDFPQEFEQLRRLLKLKQYEQPPPGYFDHFAGEVRARLEEAHEALPIWERLFVEAPWLKRILLRLETQPAFAGAFGAVICGLLLFGVVYSQSIDSDTDSTTPLAVDSRPAGALALNAKSSMSLMDNHALPAVSSTNAILNAGLGISPFDAALGNVKSMPVSFNLGGN
ncbi:MAG TPA: hypothetical protein VH598_15020 [Verrucomicrobiae bacterium]|nr:hypothetical protein [Verrucomicrobiae bacterium]